MNHLISKPDNGETTMNQKADFNAFVIMPFAKEFNNVYQLVIKEACKSAGVFCLRVDEEPDIPEHIVETIYQRIREADIIIADLTGANPNVYYELGYAKAHGKKIIPITQDYDDLRFDFKSYSVQEYYLETLHNFRDELTKIITDKLKSPEKGFDILGVYPNSADLQTIMGELTSSAKESIIFSGAHFGISASDRRNELLRKLKEGVKITYHIIDPSSSAVTITAKVYGMREDELKAECRTGITILDGLYKEAGEFSSNLRIVLSTEQPQARYMLFDHKLEKGRIFVTPYVDDLRSSHTPSYQFRSKAEVAKSYIDCCLRAIGRGKELLNTESNSK